MAAKKLKKTLVINNLHAKSDDEEILKGLNLKIKPGEIHAIMGPNGSGKSTLCNAVMGHPNVKITKGEVLLNKKDLLKLSPDKRAAEGLFLGFQYPREVAGVTFGNFMRIAVNTVNKAQNKEYKPVGPAEYYPLFQKEIENMKMHKKFAGRCLNEGFSGGEKKRAEIVQMILLKPAIAMLDEIDSGLDIDGLKLVASGIKKAHQENGTGILLITHYARILKFIKPDFVHVMSDGKIVESGDYRLANQLEKKGYSKFISNHA